MKNFAEEFGRLKYDLGDIVYLITDPNQDQFMITGLTFSIDGGSSYEVRSGINSAWVAPEEISKTKNVK